MLMGFNYVKNRDYVLPSIAQGGKADIGNYLQLCYLYDQS